MRRNTFTGDGDLADLAETAACGFASTLARATSPDQQQKTQGSRSIVARHVTSLAR